MIPGQKFAFRNLVGPGAFLGASFAAIALSAYASQYVWRENGLKALQAINEPRIELIASAVRSEINRQDHLPIVLSLDADVRAVLAGPANAERLDKLNDKLARIIVEADTGALYVIAKDRTTPAPA